MWTGVLEVAVVAVVAAVVIAPLLSGALRRARSTAGGDEGRRRWAGWVGGVLFAVAIANFLAYSVHTQNLGGSADAARSVEGRYVVSSHGKFTEVTEDQWGTVRAHEAAVFVTHPLALLVGVPLVLYARRGRGSGTD
jgi:hypothetical protein